MRTHPFDGYLDAFAVQYRSFCIDGHGEYVWHHELDTPDVCFPIPSSFLARAARAGHLPSIKHKGMVCYAMADLMGFLRMHSIANYGLYYHAPVRPAEVLALNEHHITVATAFVPSHRRPQGGQMCFVCPMCGIVHFHGTGPGFGGGDGSRVPHCTTPYVRLDARPLARRLAPNWQFVLNEVTLPDRAGDFPRELQKLVVSRAQEGEA